MCIYIYIYRERERGRERERERYQIKNCTYACVQSTGCVLALASAIIVVLT